MKAFLISIIVVIIIAAGAYYYFYRSQGIVGNNILVRGIISLSSPNFENGSRISKRFTCDGENISPTLDLDRVPSDAKSVVLIVTDADSLSKDFTHWLVYNINPEVTRIDEGTIPQGGVVLINDFGKREYDGPCPPLGLHKYYFRVYAVNTILPVDGSYDRATIDKLTKGHIVAKGETFVEYIRN